MFTKYMGQLGKAEAEWIREIEDLAGGSDALPEYLNTLLERIRRNCSEMRIHRSRWNRLKRFLRLRSQPQPKELSKVAQDIVFCYLVNPRWITEGLDALHPPR